MTTATEPQATFGWERATEREERMIPLEKIHVPSRYERTDAPKEDEQLVESIRSAGVEQPIHVVPTDDGYTLVKGTRRLSASYVCRYPKIPAIIEPPPPPGVDMTQYCDRIRFHLTIRQNLKPSQNCAFILQTMDKFGMNQKEVARYLKCDPGTITNHLAIRNYIPEIVQAIDAGDITLFHGRSFDGMSEIGQKKVWQALRKDMPNLSGHQSHRVVREKFNPKRYPEYYVAPEKTLAKLARKQKGRQSRKRPKLSKSEKDLLASDLTVKEAESRDLDKEIRDLKRVNIATGPIVRAMLADESIASLLPSDKRLKLQRFAEIY